MAETNIPNLSIDTVDAASHNSAPTFTLPAAASASMAGAVTLSGAVTQSGTLTSTGTVNMASGRFISKQTTASATSLVLRDGEMAITNLSATSAVLAVRSGNSTLIFRADSYGLL